MSTHTPSCKGTHTTPIVGNLFATPDAGVSGEHIEVLASGAACRVERIVSCGHTSPAGFWYDQDRDEWVSLLSGAAQLLFENGRSLTLTPGDHLLIPAHCRHRVEWTHPEQATVWVAVHLAADSDNASPGA